MRDKLLISLFLAGTLVACQEAPRPPEVMADVCQLRKCVCAESDAPILFSPDTTEILWRQSGAAYCPEGFELRLDEDGGS